jgi:RecJ-like exonuclease
MEGYDLIMIDLDKTSFRGFPSSGKGVGILFKYLNEIKHEKSLCIGFTNDRITLRIPKDINKTVQGLMESINDAKIIIDGGGHPKAGTIFFAQAYKERIMGILNRWIELDEENLK